GICSVARVLRGGRSRLFAEARSGRREVKRLEGSLIAAACALALGAAGCQGAKMPTQGGNVDSARRARQRSNDGEGVGQWLLAEVIPTDGDAAKAKEARARLEKLPHEGMYASLGRAIDDGGHGHLEAAAAAYLDTVRAARTSTDPRAPLIAWFATNHLL